MTHGILSNGTVDIPVTLRQEMTNYFHVIIDGEDNDSLIGFLRGGWTFTPDPPVEPNLPYGIYATKAWSHTPESSILWRYSQAGWRALDTRGNERGHHDHPRDLYATRSGKNWWGHIVRLTAEEQ